MKLTVILAILGLLITSTLAFEHQDLAVGIAGCGGWLFALGLIGLNDVGGNPL